MQMNTPIFRLMFVIKLSTFCCCFYLDLLYVLLKNTNFSLTDFSYENIQNEMCC